MKLAISLLAIISVSCSREVARINAMASDATIRCYSGGQLVFSGVSDGRVAAEESGSGYSWRDKESRMFIRSNADCIISQK